MDNVLRLNGIKWNKALTIFKVEAVDLDKRGTQNSHVRYEIIKVNDPQSLVQPKDMAFLTSEWRYEIGTPPTPLKFLKLTVLSFQGNYENKFMIDEESGEIKVVEPLKQRP